MVMQTLQIRLTKKHLEGLKQLVDEGFYSSRNEAVRDSIRRLLEKYYERK